MADLNLSLDYFDHIKTIRLVSILGPGSDVLPIKLWAYAGKFFIDGDLSSHEKTEIEAIVKWWGEKGKMIDALQKVGYMDSELRLIGFTEHQGHIAVLKQRAKAGAKARWKGIKKQTMLNKHLSIAKNKTSNAPSNPSIPSAPSNPSIPSVSPEANSIKLSESLKTWILKNNPTAKVPQNLDAWILEADRLYRIDNRNPTEVDKVLSFSQSDNFWKTNILSMDKFRKQYDRLKMQMEMKNNGNDRGSVQRARPPAGASASDGSEYAGVSGEPKSRAS